MPIKVTPNNFEEVLRNELEAYQWACFDALFDAISSVASESRDKLRRAGSFEGNTYRRKWRWKAWTIRLGCSAKVYVDAPEYRLSHLLEKGHRIVLPKWDTGRRTRAFVHIAPINDWAQKEAPKRFEENLYRKT